MQEKDGKITVEVFPDRKTARKEFNRYKKVKFTLK